jgi:hypothetical protein
MQKIRFIPTARIKDLTIIIVARNLISLYYPFIESLYSAIPLGCNFLVGDFSSDNTAEIYRQLSHHLPIHIIKLKWADHSDGTSIGIATQDLAQQSPTRWVLNLQACEILCEDAVKGILGEHPWMGGMNSPGPTAFHFRHFWGNFNFDGSIHGRAYGEAPRLFDRNTQMNGRDGCYPNDYPGGWPILGTIHRYSYCFQNQVRAKAYNHYALYKGRTQSPDDRFRSIEFCIQNSNYSGSHPECVQHLIGQTDYSLQQSYKLLLDALC